MAPGNVHNNVWKAYKKVAALISGSVIAFGVWQGNQYIVVLGVAIFLSYLTAKVIEPDLDQPIQTQSETAAIRWLPMVGYAWLAWWTIYAMLIFLLATLTGTTKGGYLGGHRSVWSHSLFPGTPLRMLWADLPLLLLLCLASDTRPLTSPYTHVILLGQLIGLAINDLNHYRFDVKGIDYGRYDY